MSTSAAPVDDRVKYADCMTYIRYRLQVIDKLSSGQFTTGYEIPDLESIGLQFRMIFELIAMSSICANKEYCQEVRRRFDKLWNAAEIVRFVEDINPNYYPVPLKRKLNQTPRTARSQRSLRGTSRRMSSSKHTVDVEICFMHQTHTLRANSMCATGGIASRSGASAR